MGSCCMTRSRESHGKPQQCSGQSDVSWLVLLGRVALRAQRPTVIKLCRVRSVGRSVGPSVGLSVCLSVQCIVEKRQIAAGIRLAP